MLFKIKEIFEKCDQNIATVFFYRSIFGTADTAGIGLEIPDMNFCFQLLAAIASSPVLLRIRFYIREDVNVTVRRTKLVGTVYAS